jgi:ATP-dependent helicase HrpB
VAREREGRLGDEVGYQIRFEDRSAPHTRIKFETEGILLRHLLGNPALNGIGAILFDEFHERHLYGDITLARALQVQKEFRPDLKLVVMSATLDVDLALNYLEPCECMASEGRVFPVEHEYLPRPANPKTTAVWDLAAREFERLTKAGHDGDVLVFMPGAYEIGRTVRAIQASQASKGCVVMPLHGELSAHDQDAAVERYDRRKVVVSTNVAETSLTIDGIRLVIDSGLARMARFDPHRGINTLLVEKISRASAEQRAGRAGRTAPGHCMRLWTEQQHRERAEREVPEIKRLDLSEVILSLKAAGVERSGEFAWVEPPAELSLFRAEQLLNDLGAIEGIDGPITEVGRQMVAFPIHPRYSRMLLAAEDLECVREAALIAALTQGRNVLIRTKDAAVKRARSELLGEEVASDFFLLMRAWGYAERYRYDLARCKKVGIHAGAARQVRPLLDRFLRIAKSNGLTVNEHPPLDEAVQQCVLAGFADQVAVRRDGGTLRCDLVHGRVGELAKESVVRDGHLLVASEIHEIERGRKDLNVLLTLGTVIEEAWLKDRFPEAFNESDEVTFDRTSRRVIAFRARRFRDLVLDMKRKGEVPEDAAAEVLAKEVEAGRCTLKLWDHGVEQMLLRIEFARKHAPGVDLPDWSGPARLDLLRRVCRGAKSAKDLKTQPVLPAVKSALNRAQRELVEKLAPERLQVPGGPKAKLVYRDDGVATVAVRIQELYAVKQSLRLPGTGEPVTVQILAPNHRPVQVTQDLTTFWRESYPKVKAELQKKYPKHEWR